MENFPINLISTAGASPYLKLSPAVATVWLVLALVSVLPEELSWIGFAVTQRNPSPKENRLEGASSAEVSFAVAGVIEGEGCCPSKPEAPDTRSMPGSIARNLVVM